MVDDNTLMYKVIDDVSAAVVTEIAKSIKVRVDNLIAQAVKDYLNTDDFTDLLEQTVTDHLDHAVSDQVDSLIQDKIDSICLTINID